MAERPESIITPDGHERILNLQPSPPELVRLVRSSPTPAIPLSQIKPFRRWPEAVKIKDQNGYGACNGHAAATSIEAARVKSGAPHVPLSAWFVYGRLAKGVDRGSNILQALDLVQREGVPEESLVKYGDFSGRYSADVQEAAKEYRAEVAYKVEAWEDLATAVALGRYGNMSVRVPRGGWSGRLDANGCPEVGVGAGNHAVTFGGGIKVLSNGEVLILMANSWSTKWGDNGFCWLSRAHWERGTWREAYVVAATIGHATDGKPA